MWQALLDSRSSPDLAQMSKRVTVSSLVYKAIEHTNARKHTHLYTRTHTENLSKSHFKLNAANLDTIAMRSKSISRPPESHVCVHKRDDTLLTQTCKALLHESLPTNMRPDSSRNNGCGYILIFEDVIMRLSLSYTLNWLRSMKCLTVHWIKSITQLTALSNYAIPYQIYLNTMWNRLYKFPERLGRIDSVDFYWRFGFGRIGKYPIRYTPTYYHSNLISPTEFILHKAVTGHRSFSL